VRMTLRCRSISLDRSVREGGPASPRLPPLAETCIAGNKPKPTEAAFLYLVELLGRACYRTNLRAEL
jgi:hypothetical protein